REHACDLSPVGGIAAQTRVLEYAPAALLPRRRRTGLAAHGVPRLIVEKIVVRRQKLERRREGEQRVARKQRVIPPHRASSKEVAKDPRQATEWNGHEYDLPNVRVAGPRDLVQSRLAAVAKVVERDEPAH